MRLILICTFIFTLNNSANAQLAITRVLSKPNIEKGIGYGSFIKCAYPISDNSDLTFEAGFNIFSKKTDSTDMYSNTPVKIGYRYIFGKKRYGFYLGPVIGFNINGLYGNNPKPPRYIKEPDTEFYGVIASPSFGYLFKPGVLNLDIEIIYETNIIKGQDLNYLGLRLSHNFSFNKKRSF